jgi:hypothetical protein
MKNPRGVSQKIFPVLGRGLFIDKQLEKTAQRSGKLSDSKWSRYSKTFQK